MHYLMQEIFWLFLVIYISYNGIFSISYPLDILLYNITYRSLMSFSDHFISKYINKTKESSDEAISASLIPPKIDLLEMKNEIDAQPSTQPWVSSNPETSKDVTDEKNNNVDDSDNNIDTTDSEWVANSEIDEKKETTQESIVVKEEKETKQSKETTSSHKPQSTTSGSIIQKQHITPGRMAWVSNKVEWRTGILSHNDKLPPKDNTILSPVNGVVVWIKNNYKENKKSRSLSKPSFGNYVVIKITDGPFAWLTYHLGHIDKNIPLTLWSPVEIGKPIGFIKYGSGSGTGRHYSDAIWSSDATSMSYQYHGSYIEQTAQFANITITDQKSVVFNDGSSHSSSSTA